MNATTTAIDHLIETLTKIGDDPEWKGYLLGSRIFIHGPEKLERKQLLSSDLGDGHAFDPLQAAAVYGFVRQGLRPAERINNAAAALLLGLGDDSDDVFIAHT